MRIVENRDPFHIPIRGESLAYFLFPDSWRQSGNVKGISAISWLATLNCNIFEEGEKKKMRKENDSKTGSNKILKYPEPHFTSRSFFITTSVSPIEISSSVSAFLNLIKKREKLFSSFANFDYSWMAFENYLRGEYWISLMGLSGRGDWLFLIKSKEGGKINK